MNLTKNMVRISLVTLTLGLIVGCVQAPVKKAILLDSEFQPSAIESITMLPTVDARLEHAVEVDLQVQLNESARELLKGKGYVVQMDDSNGSVGEVTKDDLKSAEPEFIKELGPSDARWVMVLVLDDVTTRLTFGSTGNADVSGYMFDKQSAETVWRDKGIGKAGQGGLIGMMMKGSMGSAAVNSAVNNLMASIPKRSE